MAIEYRLFQAPVSETNLSKFTIRLQKMINEAFATQDRSYYGTEDIFPDAGNMIPSPETVATNLGEVGFAAVALDTGAYGNDENPEPVAISCMKPWTGRAVAKWEAMTQKRDVGGTGNDSVAEVSKSATTNSQPGGVTEWELVCVASKNDPKYRHQGHVKRCIEMVEQHLATKLAEFRHDSQNQSQVNIWVTALEQIGNVEYYEKRGFIRDGESDAAYTGVWGCKVPFEIAHLRKVIKIPKY